MNEKTGTGTNRSGVPELSEISDPSGSFSPADVLGPGSLPSLAEILAQAPMARLWAETSGALVGDYALALDLGARFLRSVPGLPRPGSGRGSSAEKGTRGEDAVYELLARHRRVRDVSRRAHSG